MATWSYETSFEPGQGYSTGNLTGQDSWTGATGTMTVTTAQAIDGTQSVTANSSSSNLRSRVVTSADSDGTTMYFSLRASSVASAGGIGGIDIYQSTSTLIGQIYMNYPLAADITFRLAAGSPGSPKIKTGAAANTWYRIGIEFDFTNNNVRCNVDGGAFGSWIATGVSLNSVDRIDLVTISDGASYDFFWDNFSASYSSTPVPNNKFFMLL